MPGKKKKMTNGDLCKHVTPHTQDATNAPSHVLSNLWLHPELLPTSPFYNTRCTRIAQASRKGSTERDKAQRRVWWPRWQQLCASGSSHHPPTMEINSSRRGLTTARHSLTLNCWLRDNYLLIFFWGGKNSGAESAISRDTSKGDGVAQKSGKVPKEQGPGILSGWE